jgi:hypothetical protein
LVCHDDALAIKFSNDEWRIFIPAFQSPTFDIEKGYRSSGRSSGNQEKKKAKKLALREFIRLGVKRRKQPKNVSNLPLVSARIDAAFSWFSKSNSHHAHPFTDHCSRRLSSIDDHLPNSSRYDLECGKVYRKDGKDFVCQKGAYYDVLLWR